VRSRCDARPADLRSIRATQVTLLAVRSEQVAHHLSLCLLACIMRQHASAKVLSRIKEAFTLVNDEYKIAAALICEYG
jgi:hypothetical protein